MTAMTYRMPAEWEQRLMDTRISDVPAPADAFMHEGKLNMGPTIVLASILSAGCWAIIITLGLKCFH